MSAVMPVAAAAIHRPVRAARRSRRGSCISAGAWAQSANWRRSSCLRIFPVALRGISGREYTVWELCSGPAAHRGTQQYLCRYPRIRRPARSLRHRSRPIYRPVHRIPRIRAPRHLQQRGLHFGRVDVLAAGDDHVLQPVDDPTKPSSSAIPISPERNQCSSRNRVSARPHGSAPGPVSVSTYPWHIGIPRAVNARSVRGGTGAAATVTKRNDDRSRCGQSGCALIPND